MGQGGLAITLRTGMSALLSASCCRGPKGATKLVRDPKGQGSPWALLRIRTQGFGTAIPLRKPLYRYLDFKELLAGEDKAHLL